MEENPCSAISDGEIVGIRFALASHEEICMASISDCPISHTSQLGNPFLGLPLEFGKCESCGTSEIGLCEGHFGYIQLPVPIYHPSHISELKGLLSILCFKCLKMKSNKYPNKTTGMAERLLSSCCEDTPQVSVKEVKTTDGACYLQLKLPSSNIRQQDGVWNFMERYGFRYGDGSTRSLLPCEVIEILKRIPKETKRKLQAKGYFPQDGYILKYLPIPPNCLSVPEISDGVTIMSSDPSISMLKKILGKVEEIRRSRSGDPNFESNEVEANVLQVEVCKYLQLRGTTRSSRSVDTHFGVSKELNDSSTKAWLEKMRTLFIRKGSGFSSRSVITGDAYTKVNEIGIPFEVAQRITFEEKVNMHNIKYLQELVDNKLCLTYRDGSSNYSLREGSKGHTFLRMGQIVHRRIMDGDIVFINRPPTTHKHSLQALRVYIHDDHTVKINPIICGPLSADFDGDCIHLFYPQSVSAKAEVMELFSVEKQLLSSHSGNVNLQLTTDSLLSLKMMLRSFLFDKATAQQLAVMVSSSLPPPAVLKGNSTKSYWTALQVLQTALPSSFGSFGERYLVKHGEVLKVESSQEISTLVNEIVPSIFFERGPEEVLKFFNSLQPVLMEYILTEGFSVGLDDFSISKASLQVIEEDIQSLAPLLFHLRTSYNELVEMQLESYIREMKIPVTNFISGASALGFLIDSKSNSAINKVVQQIGFLGMQLSDKKKFYSKTLIDDISSLFHSKYSSDGPNSAEYGLIKSCFFNGLDPFEEMVHSVSTREVIVRSSRGLSEPGTLFKNLMAILRDVVVCYDGTVRNVCSNSIIQFEYGVRAGSKTYNLFPPGEPVGVLAATAMSNPAYKAVLDSSPSSNSSWELMKEILLCKVNFRNEPIDRRVIMYLNDCDCGRKYCHENAAYRVKNHLKKVILKDVAVDFTIEYGKLPTSCGSNSDGSGLVGHIHLNEMLLKEFNVSIHEVLQKCEDTVISLRRKKKMLGHIFKKTILSDSECCSTPCLMFFWQESNDLPSAKRKFANTICPILLGTVIKGDPRIREANIIWMSQDSTCWIRNPSKSQRGEMALDILLEKSAVKKSGDAWRIVLDSCLPVLHLIDTRRSVPYAIKQLQELLGISATFEMAVKRLGTSVTMVTKGVLKDHLILLASSMTCAGNLVGFNSGGYKALSRALNIQVPFTEATLFTPKRCFERAAEKCHVDSLSSIVASCSWGKRVAVGTGSRFEILWDSKEERFELEDGVDVYSFLHMVRSANDEEATTACLGAEIDDLDSDNENRELDRSPDHSDKLVFEDGVEFENTLKSQTEGSTWDNVLPLNTSSVCDGGWGAEKNVVANKESENNWSNWGKKKYEDKQDKISSRNEEDISCSGGWDTMVSGGTNTEDDNGFKETTKPNPWSSRGTDNSEPEEIIHAHNQADSSLIGWEVRSSSRATTEPKNHWSGQEKNEAESYNAPSAESREDTWNSGAASWKKTRAVDASGFSKNDERPHTDQPWDSNSWDNMVIPQETEGRSNSWKKTEAGNVSGFNRNNEQPHINKTTESTDWDNKVAPHETESQSKWGCDSSTVDKYLWGQQKSQGTSKGWGSQNKSYQAESKQKAEVSGGWGSQNESSQTESMWNTQVSQGWGSQNETSQPESKWNTQASHGRGSQNETSQPESKQNTQPSGGWGSQDESSQTESKWDTQVSQGWGSQNETSQPENKWNNQVSHGQGSQNETSQPESKQNTQPSGGWGSQNESSQTESKWDAQVSQGWGSQNETSRPESKWNTQVSHGQGSQNVTSQPESKQNTQLSQGWGGSQNESKQLGSLNGWDSTPVGANNENDKNQWGQPVGAPFNKKQSEDSKGWGPAGDWKVRKNRPPKSPGLFHEDSNVGGMYTASRQRLDMFTSEEHDVLTEVESVMYSIRRIMHQSGYNDGDRLSDVDQTYILEKVFDFHPDKAVKMGAGVDHFTVNRHTIFPESRCFFVNSTDGRVEDFSYRKCLNSFIMGKYPSVAETFIGKYWKPPRVKRDPSPVTGGSNNPVPEETQKTSES